MSPSVSILGFLPSDDLSDRIKASLSQQRHVLSLCHHPADFLQAAQGQPSPDCLIVEHTPQLSEHLTQLRQQTTLLPIVILSREFLDGSYGAASTSTQQYHPGAIWLKLNPNELADEPLTPSIDEAIDQAIKKFLQISPSDPLIHGEASLDPSPLSNGSSAVLQDQQRRLAEKLRERLGYLGVYYKRDSRHFLRNLPQEDVTEILDSLQKQYKEIVLSYFSETAELNSAIDEFVNTAFFTDISVTKIVEIHMELMDEFSKQLKLEGRSEEMLVDYRLTLLDIVAHLCEMYRRSIPRES